MPLQIVRQNVSKMQVDAVVNTTNREMTGYSGVDLALHTAAGDGLDRECSALVPLGDGCAKITRGYNLPCKYVIHTAGPVWRGGAQGEEEVLRSCYVESMRLAAENGCESIAFPLISSGAYRYPKDRVLKVAIQSITEFLLENEMFVFLCVFDKESYSFSKKLFGDIKAFIDEEYVEAYGKEFSSDSEGIRNLAALPRKKRKVRAKNIATAPRACSPIEKEESLSADFGIPPASLADYLRDTDMSFREMLFSLIDERGIRDVECYKRANVDKRTFSKIKSNKDYKPSKQTVIAFAISLRLNFEETQKLLATVGFTLSASSVFDKIIAYFIINGNHNVFEINEALFEFDQPLLGV